MGETVTSVIRVCRIVGAGDVGVSIADGTVSEIMRKDNVVYSVGIFLDDADTIIHLTVGVFYMRIAAL